MSTREELTPDELDRSRLLALFYVVASTLILAVSGLLGVVLRFSQADFGRIGDNSWYALMTAHGLGAFVGWAAFAVMGFSWWILAQVGFPIRKFGEVMAWLTWWLMVLGVGGVVLTTMFFGFAGSWVFLYPLPFHSAGEWGDATTGVFAASVLLAGLSIVTWCIGILHTVVGPALHAVSDRLPTRLGVAMGFGYLWPKRFATNPEPVPYVVIPLTVIAIDMIIATLPLAGLLVEMVIQSFADVSVDPLLAKNVLWWFGHPVVYLLLFPAVSIFYFLVPRYAGRQLVAGGVIAVAWTIAVIANVFVWAHHMYLDYPEGSIQGSVNLLMEPTTFALVLPSALSIYALAFTIFRSRYTWNAASTALFLALLSWALSGLSGIVNATIAFQETIHNTLWVVGHFHHMAIANIGLVVIAATYAFLPELVGKPLYSERMAKWHVWATFLLVTANSALWLWQGLEGAPRRFAVLPKEYEGLAKAALPIVAVLAAAQLLFFWNIFQTLRGRGMLSPAERAERRATSSVEAGIMLLMLALAAAAFVVGWVIGRETAPEAASGTGTTGAATTPPAARGEGVFASAGCGNCHTLAAAEATGTVGPDLGKITLTARQIAGVVTNGRGGMPSFADQLSQDEIAAVAAYVAASETS